MGTRRPWLVLALLLIPVGARADRHNWEAYAGASAATGGSLLWGGNLSIAGTLNDDCKGFFAIKDRCMSFFVVFSKHAGPHDGGSLTETSALVGPRRVVYRTLKYSVNKGVHFRLQFFVQGLAGIVHTSSEGGDWAAGAGAGVDALFSDYGGVRAQVDRIWSGAEGDRDRFFRFSLGLIYRFEREDR